MHQAILVGNKHGETKLTVLAGPDDPREISRQYKALVVEPGEIQVLQLWDSHAGILKRKRFDPIKTERNKTIQEARARREKRQAQPTAAPAVKPKRPAKKSAK